MEEWKEIPRTDGIYFVSNLGRVKSRDHTITDKNGRRVHCRGRELVGSNNGAGYLRVAIIVCGKKTRVYIHRLVAESFVVRHPGCDVVNHKDFNTKNNCADNLEWVTSRGNYDYSFDRGRFARTNKWKAHLKESLDRLMAKPVVGREIGKGTIVKYRALNDCAKDGFQPSCVSQCCNGMRKSHHGFEWEFDNGTE